VNRIPRRTRSKGSPIYEARTRREVDDVQHAQQRERVAALSLPLAAAEQPRQVTAPLEPAQQRVAALPDDAARRVAAGRRLRRARHQRLLRDGRHRAEEARAREHGRRPRRGARVDASPQPPLHARARPSAAASAPLRRYTASPLGSTLYRKQRVRSHAQQPDEKLWKKIRRLLTPTASSCAPYRRSSSALTALG
jgi:hypothetical protein